MRISYWSSDVCSSDRIEFRGFWRRAMGFRVKLVASALALALAAVSVGGARAQSISQALTIAYDHAPDLQAALPSAKAGAENVALAPDGRAEERGDGKEGGRPCRSRWAREK